MTALPSMTNANDTEPGGLIGEAEFEKLHGRTWTLPPPAIRVPRTDRAYGVVLAVLLGILGAALLVHYLSR